VKSDKAKPAYATEATAVLVVHLKNGGRNLLFIDRSSGVSISKKLNRARARGLAASLLRSPRTRPSISAGTTSYYKEIQTPKVYRNWGAFLRALAIREMAQEGTR